MQRIAGKVVTLGWGIASSCVKDDSPLLILWRHKWLVLLVTLVFAVATALISRELPKVYSAQATLMVVLDSEQQGFDSVQASQAMAHSFTDILLNPTIAAEVAERLGEDPNELSEKVSAGPVSQTQLIAVNAEDGDPERARDIAQTYADVFLEQVASNLAEPTGSTVLLAVETPVPEQAVRPRPLIYTLFGALLGFALGVALAFGRELRDRRLRTFDDFTARFDIPVLARLPRREKSERSRVAFREGHRVLRANLQFAAHDNRQVRVVAISSSEAGEGKTTVVAELAHAAAEVGMRVLTIDADFRQPRLQREMLPDLTQPLTPGFSNYLVGAGPLEDVIHGTDRPGLFFVPTGPLPPTPSALLESRSMREAIEQFRVDFDLILIDCPPVSAGADVSLIARGADVLLLVVSLGQVSRDAVRDALARLEGSSVKPDGVILNRDGDATNDSYYYAAGR